MVNDVLCNKKKKDTRIGRKVNDKMKRIELSYSRARKLVEWWEGHIINHTRIQDCAIPEQRCPLNKWFMEIKKKVEVRKLKGR